MIILKAQKALLLQLDHSKIPAVHVQVHSVFKILLLHDIEDLINFVNDYVIRELVNFPHFLGVSFPTFDYSQGHVEVFLLHYVI